MASERHQGEVQEREAFLSQYGQRGLVIRNLKGMELHRRELRRNEGAYFELAENKIIDAHVSEIAPGGHGGKHRHNNEAIIYILSGRGYSLIQREGEPEQRVEWQEGDLLSPPLFAWHQHFNADPQKPVRYLAITTVPLVRGLGLLRIEGAGG